MEAGQSILRRQSISGIPRQGLYYDTDKNGHYHSGKCLLATVGLPARGKTHISLALKRYLSWLGVSVEVFHLQEYRRKYVGKRVLPKDYFTPNKEASQDTIEIREHVMQKCIEDIEEFFRLGGQVAIYDALNTRRSSRKRLIEHFKVINVGTTFLEFISSDEDLIQEHLRSLSLHNPDYAGWDPKEAVEHYLSMMSINEANQQTIDKSAANVIRVTNISEKLELQNLKLDFLTAHIVFYIMNMHTKPRSVYFARAGRSVPVEKMKQEGKLSGEGAEYAKNLAYTFQKIYEKKDTDRLAWCSVRANTIQTAQYLADKGWKVWSRPQLAELNCGSLKTINDGYIREHCPLEYEQFLKDTWLYRFPRSESYRDLALRLESVILQLENETRDLVIVAHSTVLRVIYAYLKAVPSDQIHYLSFSRDFIIELRSSSYGWIKSEIPIEMED